LHQRFSVFHENSVDLPKKFSACGEHWTPAARPRYAPAPLKKLRLQVSWRPLTLAGAWVIRHTPLPVRTNHVYREVLPGTAV
jgi:hypothetical protein